MSIRVLFVCTGNTCRSPMAEALARWALEPGVEVSSAGLQAWEGQAASPQAIEALKEKGLDLSSHQARMVTIELMQDADWIVPMTQGQEECLRSLFPEFDVKIKKLSAWTGKDEDILDPFGQSVQFYKQCADKMLEMLQAFREQIS